MTPDKEICLDRYSTPKRSRTKGLDETHEKRTHSRGAVLWPTDRVGAGALGVRVFRGVPLSAAATELDVLVAPASKVGTLREVLAQPTK